MRGIGWADWQLFSYVDLEDRVPAKHPLRLIRGIVNDVLVALDREFAKIYAAGWAAVDPAGAIAAGAAAAGVLHDPVGDAAHGATRLQSAVPLVRRAWRRRAGVGADGVHEEPRPAARGRGGAQVSRRCSITRRCAVSCPTSTSRSTAPRSRLGLR